MSRRVISIGSVLIAVAALAVVLANATLVDRRGPGVASVSLSAPVDGQEGVAQTLTAIDIQFSEPVRTATVERRFAIEPYVAGTLSWDGSTATFTPSDKLPADTEFTVSIDPGFEDLAGNQAATGVDAFTFRTIGPPAVAEVDPVDGTEGVALDAAVTITFDRLMDTSAVEEAIRVEPPATVSPSWSGRALTLAFESPLQFATTYTITVDASAADTDGSRLRAPFSTSFTTVAAGLRIAGTVPHDGVAGVSTRSPIAVVFDGPIEPASIAGALTITPPVAGDVQVVALPDDTVAPRPDASPPGTVLLLQPSQPLAEHTTYTLRLDPVVARLGSPDQVAAARTWRFTTGQPTASAHNHVAYFSSRGGSRDVWVMNPDGSAPRQVTSGLAPVSGFDVTADGSRIAYAVGGEVRTGPIDGSGETVVTQAGRFEYAPRFSPDGRSLLVGRREADGSDAGWWLLPVDPTADAERQVLPSGAPPLGSTAVSTDDLAAGDGFPVWAGRAAFDPSGRWVAVTVATGEVRLVDLEAPEDEAVVTTGLTAASAPGWDSFRERFLVVAGLRGGPEGLWEIRTDGEVNREGEASGSLAVAPAGSAVFLAESSGGVPHVAIRRGTAVTPLTAGDDLADRWPGFSPDGRTVVFARARPDDGDPAGIWTVDVSGENLVAISTDGTFPRWLP
jgi:hypothetical protein